MSVVNKFTFPAMVQAPKLNFVSAMTDAPAIEWGAATLQVALFSKTKPFAHSMDLYRDIFGAEPDVNEERPKEGVRRQAGQIGEAQVQVGINPLRVDVILSPIENANLGAEGIPVIIGEYGAEADRFAELVTNWVGGFDFPLARISFLSVAVAPAGSREEAYEILSRQVKSLKITPNMRDLLYRVNWRAPTKRLTEGYLNRLATWSSFQLIASAGLAGQQSSVKLSERNFARLDLDVNTPAEREEVLPQAELAGIFRELFAFARDTVIKGECVE